MAALVQALRKIFQAWNDSIGYQEQERGRVSSTFEVAGWASGALHA